MICLAVGLLLGSGSVQLAISESISLGHSSGTLLQHRCVSWLALATLRGAWGPRHRV